MCLIFIAYNKSLGHRYVIAANRDEFRRRKTAPLDYLGETNNIVGGQDLQAGGMWLGVCRGGKFGAITNYREGTGSTANLPSRGEIVSQYLHSNESAKGAIERLAEDSEKYAGFNVVFGDDRHLIYFSNKQNEIQILQPGFYGLSNRFLDSPWPKVEKGKDLLRPYMCDCEDIDAAAITALLQDTTVPDDTLLPDTGIGLELERFLGSIFIDGNEYGTRSTAVVEIGYQGDVIFTETSYIHDLGVKKNISQKRMSFDLNT